MLELVEAVAPYAPLAIFIVSVLDILFLTGLFMYGGTTLGALSMLYVTGMVTIPEIVIASLFGTLLGNQINYWVGRMSHSTDFVQRRLANERTDWAIRFLRTRGLLLYMISGNFITFFRPVYGLILGAIKIRWRRFVMYDLLTSSIWVSVWLSVIIFGEQLWLTLFA